MAFSSFSFSEEVSSLNGSGAATGISKHMSGFRACSGMLSLSVSELNIAFHYVCVVCLCACVCVCVF